MRIQDDHGIELASKYKEAVKFKMNEDPCTESTNTGELGYLEKKLREGLESVFPATKSPPKKKWMTEATLANVMIHAEL